MLILSHSQLQTFLRDENVVARKKLAISHYFPTGPSFLSSTSYFYALEMSSLVKGGRLPPKSAIKVYRDLTSSLLPSSMAPSQKRGSSILSAPHPRGTFRQTCECVQLSIRFNLQLPYFPRDKVKMTAFGVVHQIPFIYLANANSSLKFPRGKHTKDTKFAE